MRKRTGLRNKYRTGRSTYSIKKKSRNADKYGWIQNGYISDTIAGRGIRYQVGSKEQ